MILCPKSLDDACVLKHVQMQAKGLYIADLGMGGAHFVLLPVPLMQVKENNIADLVMGGMVFVLNHAQPMP